MDEVILRQRQTLTGIYRWADVEASITHVQEQNPSRNTARRASRENDSQT